jgi:V/A-type H+-transporting ATPase subunit C
MSALATYAYLNARLRAKLSKLISPQLYEQLARTADLATLLGALRQTEYAASFQTALSAQDIPRAEAALVEQLILSHREVAAHSKGEVRHFIEELMRQFEVENLKVILRVWKAKEGSEFVYRGYISNEIPVDAILQAETIEEIIVLLGDTPYRKPLGDAREKYKRTDSLFYLEVALDRELYEATWAAIQDLSPPDRRIASKLIGIEIDILNINSILRSKRYYNLGLADVMELMIPGGSKVKEELVREAYPGRDYASVMSALLTGVYGTVPHALRTVKEVQALHLLEGFLRETYARELRKALGGFPFTIGTAIAYLRLKKLEVSNIITLLNAKAFDRPPEEIASNLVRV